MATIDIKLKSYDELTFEIIRLNTDLFLKEQEIERLNNIIEKAVEYIKNTEDMCYYGKCNDGDLLIEVEEDFKNELLNILNGRSDE